MVRYRNDCIIMCPYKASRNFNFEIFHIFRVLLLSLPGFPDMRLSALLHVNNLCAFLAGMVPVPTEPPAELNLDALPRPELEHLLHFAIRNSNLTKLREMADRNERISEDKFRQLLAAVEDTEKIVRETIEKTIVSKSWDDESGFIAGIQLIQDYGDHLVDKSDTLHKAGALQPLLDWLINPQIYSTRITLSVIQEAAQLVADITQNREPAKTLVLQLRPSYVEELFSTITEKWWSCTANESEICAAYILVINSLIANNEPLQDRISSSVLKPLAERLNRGDVTSPVFGRLLSTFKIVKHSSSSSNSWVPLIDTESLLRKTADVRQVSVGLRIVELVEQIHSIRGIELGTSSLRHSLFQKCVAENGSDDEWCTTINANSNNQHRVDEL